QQPRRDPLRTGLGGGGTQRFLNGQCGLHQRCQLAGNQCQVAGRQTADETEAARAAVFPGARLLDLQRRPLLVAQQLPGLARAVRLDQALLLAPARIQRDVLEGGHQTLTIRWRGRAPTVGAPPPARSFCRLSSLEPAFAPRARLRRWLGGTLLRAASAANSRELIGPCSGGHERYPDGRRPACDPPARSGARRW